jgi:hypothetical protein
MDAIKKDKLTLCSLIILGVLTHIPIVSANMPASLYSEYLRIADEKVQRDRFASIPTNVLALNSEGNATYLPVEHDYKVGDHWRIAAWPVAPISARKVGLPEKPAPVIGEMSLFKYEILEVKKAPQPTIRLKITVEKSSELAVGSTIIKELTLGAESYVSGTFPPIIPNMKGSMRKSIDKLPTLPEKIQKRVNEVQYQPDLPLCNWFEQQDFFGRTIQILWRPGSPWPEYIATPNLIALLMKGKGEL